MFDQDKDGLLNKEELRKMLSVMKLVLEENTMNDGDKEDILSCVLSIDDESLVQEVLSQSSSPMEGMTLEEYLVWSLSNPLPEQFLLLIYQVS